MDGFTLQRFQLKKSIKRRAKTITLKKPESHVLAEAEGRGCEKSSEKGLALYKQILGVFLNYSESRGAAEPFGALCSLSIS